MAALPGDARKAYFQVRLLEGDQIKPPPTIPPVDPPGPALSEASVAVVDDGSFWILHRRKHLLFRNDLSPSPPSVQAVGSTPLYEEVEGGRRQGDVLQEEVCEG